MKRYLAIFIAFMALFGIICVRLCYIAYGAGSNIVETSGDQYSRKMDIASRRGFIYDRNGVRIAGCDDGFITVTFPLELSHTDECYDDKSAYSIKNYTRYADDSPASHIIGYVNSDGNGVSGAEYYFNEYLKMMGGKIYMTYQADGVNNVFAGLPIVIYDDGYGNDAGIVLTLDIELQKAVENLREIYNMKGAIVIADIKTGEILVSASFPTYNANNISAYLNSSEGEFINRCAAGFTPGSVFKILTACAALEYNVNYMYSPYECTGEYCYSKIAHGAIIMAEAFAHSCNGYFYNLIDMIGVDRLHTMAEKFGIGQTNYIDMFYTGSGKLDMSVKNNAAIGQGGILCTPYEITRVICTVMNDGYFTDLRLFKGFFGNIVENGDNTGERIIGQFTASVVKQMMRKVVTDGIGRNAVINPDSDTGGKTASAQSGQFNNEGKEIIHSWFAGYHEGFAVTVLCENAVDITAAEVFAEVTALIGELY